MTKYVVTPGSRAHWFVVDQPRTGFRANVCYPNVASPYCDCRGRSGFVGMRCAHITAVRAHLTGSSRPFGATS